MRSILVVDDDADLRETLFEILSGEGYRVWTAADGKDALERLATIDEPCLILLDLMMPVLNGWQFRRRQLRDERLSQFPVVVMTAAGSFTDGAVNTAASLSKPVDVDELLRVVDRTCPGEPDAEFDDAPETTKQNAPAFDDEPTPSGVIHRELDLEDSNPNH
jgi:CheY-like chemotaxis protein